MDSDNVINLPERPSQGSPPAPRHHYRAFPHHVLHPKEARKFLPEEFDGLPGKRLVHSDPGKAIGHGSTDIWFVPPRLYVVHLRFDTLPDLYVKSLCTVVTPDEMDPFDERIAGAIEAYYLYLFLGVPTSHLSLFQGREQVEMATYLKAATAS